MYSGTEISHEDHARICRANGLITPEQVITRTRIMKLSPYTQADLTGPRAQKAAASIDRALKKIGVEGNYEIDSTAIAKVLRKHYGDEAGEVLRRAAQKADEL